MNDMNERLLEHAKPMNITRYRRDQMLKSATSDIQRRTIHLAYEQTVLAKKNVESDQEMLSYRNALEELQDRAARNAGESTSDEFVHWMILSYSQRMEAILMRRRHAAEIMEHNAKIVGAMMCADKNRAEIAELEAMYGTDPTGHSAVGEGEPDE